MATAHLLLLRSALAGWLVCGGVTGGAGARLSAQGGERAATVVARVDHAGRRLPPGGAPAVLVPGADPRSATEWLATTHRFVAVLFSYERVEEECPARCDLYRLWVRYTSPGGVGAPSPEWRRVAESDCADFWADGARDFACATSTTMAGRDRRGNDYVLLQLYASRAQFERMLRSRALSFRVGGVGFALAPQARQALREFLVSAGPAVPR